MLFLSDGQKLKAWEPSKKTMLFQMLARIAVFSH
jgi:hypothetical protein